jgi:hypothetical protein
VIRVNRAFLAAACLPLICALHAGAAIVTYSDPNAFATAAGTLTTIDFDGIFSPPATITTLANYSTAGVTFSGVTIGAPGVYIITPSYYFEYNRDGHASIDSFQRGTPAFFNISLPAGTNAVGFDLFSVTEGVASPTDSETISVNGNDFHVTTLAYNAAHNGSDLVFFGFISTTPVTSFTITTGNLHGNTGVDIEHFRFASVATAVPEPGQVSLLFGGLMALSALLARRRS